MTIAKASWGVGFSHARVGALDTNGFPAATSTTVYDGLRITGVKTMAPTVPSGKLITETGDDGVIGTDRLGPTEGMSGELTAAMTDLDIDALIMGQKVVSVGQGFLTGIATDKVGFEAQVYLYGYRRALDKSGKRVYQTRIFPKIIMTSRQSSWDDNAETHTYDLAPQTVTQHLWGPPFDVTVEGFVRAQAIQLTSEYPYHICSWLGSGVATDFLFPPAAQPILASTAPDKVSVWQFAKIGGTIALLVQGAGAGKYQVASDATKITAGTAAADGDMLIALYEVAAGS